MRAPSIAAIAVAALILAPAAVAAPGDLNSAFSGDGLRAIDLGSNRDDASAVAIQPDGKIVVAGSVGGEAIVARFTQQGELDSDFGTGGVVTEALGGAGAISNANDVELQPDGMIVVAGYTDVDATQVRDDDMVVARFEDDGDPDTTFGDGGRREIPFGGELDQAASLARQPDGKLVVAGWTRTDVGGDVAVARLTDEGDLDESFDDDGKQRIALAPGGGDDFATEIAVTAGPKILVAGETTANADETLYDAFVLRYGDDGELDSSWSGDGIARLHVGDYTTATALAVQSDGRVLIGGATTAGTAFDVLLARFTTAGAPDPSFGPGGYRTTSVGSTQYEQATSLAVQADGRILAVGYTRGLPGRAEDMFAIRYSPAGLLDLGFSGDGRAAIAFKPAKAESDYAFDVAIAANGASATIAGRTQEQTVGAGAADSDIALVSILLAGPPDGDYDGVANAQDRCPARRGLRPHGCPDTDGDGAADHVDADDDGDGVRDQDDVAPLDRTRWLRPATSGPDTIVGGPLADTIRGLGGDDRLSGAGGADRLFGGAGEDRLFGGSGKDELVGGKGDDRLAGGSGVNGYSGGGGNDTVKARNGKRETVRCGKGSKDVATVDEADSVAGCETVKRPN